MSYSLSKDQLLMIKSLTTRMVGKLDGEKVAAHYCGTSTSTISNACNPTHDYTISAKHLVILANVTKDYSVINYLNEITGQKEVSDNQATVQKLMLHMAKMRKEDSDFDVVALEALADNSLTGSELTRMIEELTEAISEKQKTLAILNEMQNNNQSQCPGDGKVHKQKEPSK